MPLAAIEQLLQETMGLHSATVGSQTVAHAVEQRMRACNIVEPHAYHKVVSHSRTELDALIDAVIIPETWFFRDRNPFLALKDWLYSQRQTSCPVFPLRILSIPCSSGEEPYTIAMCLADCGFTHNDAQIDAIDISNENLKLARRAEYSSNSFRGSDLSFRNRHFEAVGGKYRLKDSISSRVDFSHANILDSEFVTDRRPYHVIFCRNLLIYFDRPTQRRVIDQLDKILHQEGILFLGHSETSLLLERDYKPIDFNRCFGFRRYSTNTDSKRKPQTVAGERQPLSRKTLVNAPGKSQAKPFSQYQANVAPVPDVKTANSLSDRLKLATQLANQGNLEEAERQCKLILKEENSKTEVYFLLGLIHESAGNSSAADDMLRKAIYLDPDHYEALTHLSIIVGRDGDEAGAQRLLERATRAQRRHK